MKRDRQVFVDRNLKKKRLWLQCLIFGTYIQATDAQRKFEICSRAYQLLVEKVGFDQNDIIFDPNILTIATGMKEHDNYGVEFIKSVEMIKVRSCHDSLKTTNYCYPYCRFGLDS